MERKTIALMTALTLLVSVSACTDKTVLQADTTDITSAEETTEEAEETEEETTSEPMPEITPEEKVKSAIGEMPYYGDIANCKMTAEQATAFAQLIADGLAGDFSFRGGYDENNVDILTWGEPFRVFDFDMGEKVEVDRFNVMLGDFSGYGVPYLYVFSTTNGIADQSYEIYGWADNIVKLVFDTDEGKGSRQVFLLHEDESNQDKIKMDYKREGNGFCERISYEFLDGNIKSINERSEQLNWEDYSWHVRENGVENIYTQEEYDSLTAERRQEETHIHILPYTCFYDMTPCTLEEMVNYLNAYATIMSDGQSVPVEIKKAEIVNHDGTGITTKGKVSQEKVDNLRILRQYINGEQVIATGNADSASYTEGGFVENFYFGLEDINNDGVQELLLSYKQGGIGSVQIHFPPSYKCLTNVYGIDSTNGTYLVSEGSVCVKENLYVCDGASFSVAGSITGDWDASDDGGPYTISENGEEREISADEFHSIMNDWNGRHTRVIDRVNTHLDIENIENTFQVKIDVQSSGEWLVTNVE